MVVNEQMEEEKEKPSSLLLLYIHKKHTYQKYVLILINQFEFFTDINNIYYVSAIKG